MLVLTLLSDVFAIAQLDAAAPTPAWADGGGFVSITRTASELSIVCREERVPAEVKAERGWRAFRLEGPIAFDAVGVLKQVLDPLAEAKVVVFTISTHDTDYVLVKAVQSEQAITALTRFGHVVRTYDSSQGHSVAEMIDVRCGWRLPNGARATAAYHAEVVEYDAKQDRWLVKLIGVRTAQDADATTRALIESQIGKWAYVPSEARRGLTLPLKYETLTGKPRWFYSDDPRR
jgi:hypothetical protein